VLLLLPPSEGKTAPTGRRGRPLDVAWLSFNNALGPTRAAVLDALIAASGRADALELLGVPPTLGSEVARNTALLTASTAPAASVYSGVLYEALDLPSLGPAARRRAYRWVVVGSALFGALRLADRIPAYRLSMKVNLPPLGPLAAVWRGPLAAELGAAAGRGLVVDCRSSTYAAAWVPQGQTATGWVQVAVPGATHLAKHTRGLVARLLCDAKVEVRTPARLASVVAEAFDCDLTAPRRPGQPWVLSVSAQTGST
jgi:cytoplasmic iron level regulating protein YaaA (DUF328/UPF0246 family)